MNTYIPENVHFVGSIALDGPREVFRTAGSALGSRLPRIPDGEPGSRAGWVQFQYPLFRNHAGFEIDPEADFSLNNTGNRPLRLVPGVKAQDVHLGELCYAREARASHLDFVAARKAGYIAPSTKFQVALPTPRAVVQAAFSPKYVEPVLPIYEAAMFREVVDLGENIPLDDLCIQWDVCIEMVAWDRGPGWRKGIVASESDRFSQRQGILAELKRCLEAVPSSIDVGIHLCYGDLDAKHFFDPSSSHCMVEFANALAAAADRPINYFHLPIPLSAATDDFFRPLEQLKLTKETELYLGLIHTADGLEGCRKRIAAAHKYVSSFGIATECGFARVRERSEVIALIKAHAALTGHG